MTYRELIEALKEVPEFLLDEKVEVWDTVTWRSGFVTNVSPFDPDREVTKYNPFQMNVSMVVPEDF